MWVSLLSPTVYGETCSGDGSIAPLESIPNQYVFLQRLDAVHTATFGGNSSSVGSGTLYSCSCRNSLHSVYSVGCSGGTNISDPSALGLGFGSDPFLDLDDFPDCSILGRTTGTTFSVVRTVPDRVLVCVTTTSAIPLTALGTTISQARGILCKGRSAMDVCKGWQNWYM
jgi:hypothetical protein